MTRSTRFREVLVASVLSGLGAWAGQGETARPPQSPANRTNLLAYRNAEGRSQPVKTPADWGRRREQILLGMQQVMGPLPEHWRGLPLDLKVLEEVKLPKVTRQKIAYRADPDDMITTNALACRLANYQEFEEVAWTHLPSIGIRHVFMGVPRPDQVETTRKRLAEHGLTAVVLRGDADLSLPSGVDRLAEQLATCEQMGVKFLFLSVKRHDVDQQVIYERLRRAGDLARKHGVIIALETHPDLGTNGDVQLETMKQVHHPNVQVNFDTGNIHYYNRGTDAPTELRKIVDYVATVELKDHHGESETWNFPALGRGVVDFPAVLQMLREHDYTGPVTLEIEGIKGIRRSRQDIERDLADSAAYLRSLGKFR
jgi:sugar phosphate isomerase/epimerase